MPSELVSAYCRGVLIFRIWVAGRLGLNADALDKHLSMDRVNRLVQHHARSS